VLVQLLRSLSGSAMFTFIGLWGLTRLHATTGQLSIAFLAGAVAALGSSYAGGRVSDVIGRRPPILAGALTNVLAPVGAILVGGEKAAGFVVMLVLWTLGAFGDAADQAIVADLSSTEDLERSYASMRVAGNGGAMVGPAIGGGLLAIGWTAMFTGCAALGAASVIVAWRKIPQVHGAKREPGKAAPLRVILADRRFLLLVAACMASWMVYLAYDDLMPISLVANHGLQPKVWGFLVIANPIAVTFLQLRVTNATSRLTAVRRLVIAMALMGPPFLLLGVSDSLIAIIVILIVFVFGEMLWVPAAQTAVAEAAPEDLRGAYMGAAGAAPSAAFALTPLLGLQVLSRYGDRAMWIFVTCIAAVAALLFVLALRGRPQPEMRSITTA
jgi:MFS family permease